MKNAKLRAWRQKNREHVSAYMKNWHQQRRLKAAEAVRTDQAAP